MQLEFSADVELVADPNAGDLVVFTAGNDWPEWTVFDVSGSSVSLSASGEIAPTLGDDTLSWNGATLFLRSLLGVPWAPVSGFPVTVT
jgi:hypothetical protein